jgi:antitoxin component HigA of HigAB toxin-antitoxin module
MQLNPIENSEQHISALSKIENLMAKEILSEDEKKLLIELATLVEEYETEHFPI